MILKTPNHEVTLRDFITGRQREYIDSSQFDAIKTKAAMNEQGKMSIEFGDVDTTKLMEVEKHRKIECYVTHLDGKEIAAKDILDTVLGLPEDDYEAVLLGIETVISKKKKPLEPTSPSSVEP